MKALTKNLLIFSVSLILLTILFRFSLSTMLQNRLFFSVWIVAVAYGIIVFIMGWVFGKRDNLNLPLYDVGFRFHLATYVICNLIGEIWYLLDLQSDYEKIRTIHLTALFWGIGLLIHFIIYLITRKDAIKGIKKSEIFE
ncbi:MAG: 2TM domain-containing protein [Perlabentimonas sp.]